MSVRPRRRILRRPSLDDRVRDDMESRLGHDFSGVRVHTDEAAHRAAATVNARAYTVGSDIAFQHHQYDPASSAGRELLAHELVHVAQQRSGSVHGTDARTDLRVSSPADRFEQEADRMAGRAMALPSGARTGPRRGAGDRLAHEPTHGTHPTGGGVHGVEPPRIQRKEVDGDSQLTGPHDWTTADRTGNTPRWRAACLTNLDALDSSQYVKVAERRDFYKWFHEHSAALGHTTRWALAAHLVAKGAQQIADLDVDHETANDAFDLADVELQGVLREGNQVVFDNVLPKLKKLHDGGPRTGPAALKWDMQVLAEEQTLVQPLYARMSKETVDQLDDIARKKGIVGLGAWWSDGDVVPAGPHDKAGTVPAFDQPDIQSIGDRWRYGMDLGNRFAPSPTGYDPAQPMPAVGADYSSGAEFAKVSTRANLHQLDAWLNPHRLSRVGPGSDVRTIVSRLTDVEKAQIVKDVSPDGWAYSARFAQFSAIDEALVEQALPADPSLATAVSEFLARYRQERREVEVRRLQFEAMSRHPM